MKKNLWKITLLMMSFLMVFIFAGCGDSQEAAEETAAEEVTETQAQPAEVDGSAYGYAGTDAAELAVCRYMADEISADYDEADASIPVITVVSKDESDPEDVLVKGNFEIDNYNIEEDTLKCVSGGSYPGCMHLKKNEDGTYSVTSFDAVEDGEEFEPSAREIFGDDYDKLIAAQNDDAARNAARLEAVSTYVKTNELPCTKYQDEGWDPVDLEL